MIFGNRTLESVRGLRTTVFEGNPFPFALQEPSGPPQDVHAMSRSSTSMQVYWSPPLLSERNGIITHYTVKYQPQSGQYRSVNTADNTTSIFIDNLDIFTRYSFVIKAWNVVGAGPGSQPVYNTTLEGSKFYISPVVFS